MAIFSQNDSKTEVDFRKKTEDSQVRNVPYRLPEHIREKLIEVAAKLRLDTGSFDMIVDTDNNYIFLEVNPLGQFSMTSFPCNYYLERKLQKHYEYKTTEIRNRKEKAGEFATLLQLYSLQRFSRSGSRG